MTTPLFRPLLVAIAMAACPSPAAAGVAVVGTAHLEALSPAPTGAQAARVVEALSRWAPTLVCIEAIPGERVAAFLDDPARHGELLRGFAPVAIRLGPEQQARRGLAAPAARAAADGLVHRAGALAPAEQAELVSLHLAAFAPWSAALVWGGLEAEARDEARRLVGPAAAAALDGLVGSGNEIARIALPLARAGGHRELCHADPLLDEVAVGGLADALAPMLEDPRIGEGLARFNAEADARWRADDPDGLLALLAWMQSEDFARLDHEAQWAIFAPPSAAGPAGMRRLALWHARNAEIGAHLHRAMARPDGGRVLLLIGAAHRPFLERALAAQPWVEVVPASSLLAPR